MSIKKNISRDDIANAINTEFGFSRKDCNDVVNNIIDIIIDGLTNSNYVKIHNFGTFKVRFKSSRLGRNPKTKEEVIIKDRRVISFKPSKFILKYINSKESNEEVS